MSIRSRFLILAALALLAGGCGAREDTSREPAGPESGPSRSDSIIAAKRPYADSIPLASRGRPERSSILDGRPEDPRRQDPEREAARKGYRDVEPREIELAEPTFATPEEAAQAVLDAIFFGADEEIWKLLVTKSEFVDVFWPEFPESRPFTNITVGEVWQFHDARNRDGMREALDRWGGHRLYAVDLEYTIGFTPHTNFDLYRGLVIHAVDDAGNDYTIPIVKTLAHVGGRWKVYMLDA